MVLREGLRSEVYMVSVKQCILFVSRDTYAFAMPDGTINSGALSPALGARYLPPGLGPVREKFVGGEIVGQPVIALAIGASELDRVSKPVAERLAHAVSADGVSAAPFRVSDAPAPGSTFADPARSRRST